MQQLIHTYKQGDAMNSRERFEKIFPIADGVYWNVNEKVYIAKHGSNASQLNAADNQQQNWIGWQACEASREFVVKLPSAYDTSRGLVFNRADTLAAIEAAGGRVK